ncbi:MAG: hypothetical protein CL793_01855 [Chloroflexi bacterium]|nr:hypothetical protein [Chloroflexota bacterium]
MDYLSLFSDVSAGSRRDVALLFPGQSSQTVGMGLELYQQSDSARDVFDVAEESLGQAFNQTMFYGPSEDLIVPSIAQPAVLIASIACLCAMNEYMKASVFPSPLFVAGNSLGQLTSAVAVGAISLEDAIWLARQRGLIMEAASKEYPGTTASIIGLDQIVITEIARQSGVDVVNEEAVDRFALAGAKLPMARAIDLAMARGAVRSILTESVGAAHTALMNKAVEELRRCIAEIEFRDPLVPIISLGSLTPLQEADLLRQELANELCAPLRWKASLEFMSAQGVQRFVEIGPGQVLSSLVRTWIPSADAIALSGPTSIQGMLR